jgi:hypothetical protein
MLLGAFCIRQMANQVTVQLINVDAPEIVKLLALIAENCRTRDHGNMDAVAIEYVAVHDRSPVLVSSRRRLRPLAGESETNHALVTPASRSARLSYLPFTFSPSSTRRRMASERVVLFAAAQSSTLAINSSVRRKVRVGALPVAGLPRLLGVAFFIDPAIINAVP